MSETNEEMDLFADHFIDGTNDGQHLVASDASVLIKVVEFERPL